MPIYRPEISPRLNPYGALTDITPEGLEALFEASHTANPNYTSYRIKTSGSHRIYAYVGETTFPKTLYFFVTDDGGETWARKDAGFPSNYLMEDAIVESQFYANTLWFATRTFTPGGDFPELGTWTSPDLGDNWDLAWTLSEPGFDYINHRIFPTSAGVYQVAMIFKDNVPDPDETRLVGYLDGVKILDEPTKFVISIGGITTSFFNSKYETAFFDLSFNTFLGGQEIYKVTSQGIELRGTLPQSPFTIPPTDPRPPLQQIFWIANKGILYLPTLAQTGARLYISFDEGETYEEELGALTIQIPRLTTVGRRAILRDPSSGNSFKNESFMQTFALSTLWEDVLNAYSDGIDWDVGLERRLSRRGSRFFLWELPEV